MQYSKSKAYPLLSEKKGMSELAHITVVLCNAEVPTAESTALRPDGFYASRWYVTTQLLSRHFNNKTCRVYGGFFRVLTQTDYLFLKILLFLLSGEQGLVALLFSFLLQKIMRTGKQAYYTLHNNNGIKSDHVLDNCTTFS